jgi:pyruvate/2-oxoglutarate dehydrogenase complex dihydrolipoamide dehydrogenase (E3) component
VTERVDVVVLGMGPGGEEVAGRLAQAGLSVVGVEANLLGGECPYWGCVPSKMMIRAADLLAEARRVVGMAGHADVYPDWAPVAARIRDEATDDWNDQVAVDRFVGKGGRFVRGRGRLAGRGRVAVGDQIFEASRAVGLELAQVYARFGVEVTVVEALDRLLAMEEPESSVLARDALTRDGVTVYTGVKATRVAYGGDRFTFTLARGTQLDAEALLVATGRRTDLAALGVDSVGLDPAAKAIAVDERMRAGERLWAVGDVTGRGAFTHVAMYQAGIAVRDILGQPGPPADYRALPRVTFTDPEIGGVGLTEAQARDHGPSVGTGVARVPASARGWIHKAGNDGFIKLVADTDRGVLVGATSAEPAGGEVLAALAVAVHGEVPVDRLRHMIYAYPTFHRAIEDALRALP